MKYRCTIGKDGRKYYIDKKTGKRVSSLKAKGKSGRCKVRTKTKRKRARRIRIRNENAKSPWTNKVLL